MKRDDLLILFAFRLPKDPDKVLDILRVVLPLPTDLAFNREGDPKLYLVEAEPLVEVIHAALEHLGDLGVVPVEQMHHLDCRVDQDDNYNDEGQNPAS